MEASVSTIQNEMDIPETHCFVYKNKKYPIKFVFFKYSSKFFLSNKKDLKKVKEIELIDQGSAKNINLSDEIIQSFINFVHHDPIALTNDNVTALNYLANKYEVPTLIKSTLEYIQSHHDELAVQILSIHQNDLTYQTETYENIVSSHLEDYLIDDDLLTLQIPLLYRIFKNFFKEEKKSKKIGKPLFDFLFKCLDKYGREASILFEFADFEDLCIEYMDKLFNEYSSIFDFHFVNSSFSKSLYECQNQLIQRIENLLIFCHFLDDMKIEIDHLKNDKNQQINDLKSEFDQLKSEQTKQINDLKNEFNQLKNEKNQQINDLKNEFNQINNEQTKQISELMNEIKNLHNEINLFKSEQEKQKNENEQKQKEFSNQIKLLKDENEELKSNLKKEVEKTQNIGYPIIYKNGSGNEFNGIISYLGIGNPENALEKEIRITSSSSNSEDELPTNAILYNTTEHFASQTKENSWWCIEFINHRVIPKNYTIKSNHSDPKYPHPKSWVLEGSIDNTNWEIIDEHRDCDYLNGRSLVHTFDVQNENNRDYKFLRIRQTGKNFIDKYHLCFQCIEFFGFLVLHF